MSSGTEIESMKILQSKETFVAPGFDEQNLVKSPQTVQKYQLITW
jgi:hypothetical protein